MGEEEGKEGATGEETKTDTATAASDETVKAVQERLKFFFSDANIRQDYFIRRLLMNISNNKNDTTNEYPHMVPILSLLKFNTIKKITTSPDVIVQAAKGMDDFLILSDDEKAIGLKDPFTKEKMDANLPMSLVVRNIPVKDNRYAVSREDIEKLFQDYKGVVLVNLWFKFEGNDNEDGEKKNGNSNNRRRRVPNGKCMVEFDSIENYEIAAADLLTMKDGNDNITPKKELKLQDGTILQVQSMKERAEQKKKEGKTNKNNSNNKRKQVEETVEEKKQEKEEEEIKYEFDWKPGCVISLKGVNSDKCDREELLDVIAKCMNISVQDVKDQKIYVDYSRGQNDAAIRFIEPIDAIKDICTKLSTGEIHVAGTKVESVSILQGDEEKSYWDKFIEFKTKQLKQRAEERSSNNKKKQRRNH